MVFSSILFLFIFLPIVLILHQISPKILKNIVLLLASIFFYAWGEPVYVILMLFSALFNYFMGLEIDRMEDPARRKAEMVFTTVVNLVILGFFKYFGFVLGSINAVLPVKIPYHELALPIGISFYTFQGLSYIFDVYRRKVDAQKNPISFALYLTMFPQLVAGPIVMYSDIDKQLSRRTVTVQKFGKGTERFLFGLAKKVLLANNLGLLYTTIQAQPQRSVLTVWIGMIAYTLQIYFDFSGYSDMAIGMGKMLGFDFPENFNYPYTAISVTDFWRRWHITLSTWFRDYVYIPLGGNRSHHIRNILVVWMLTGLWHGASWNFVLWGLFYGLMLLFEKYVLKNVLEALPRALCHVYTMLIVMFGWVLFSNTGFGDLMSYIGQLFGIGAHGFADVTALYYLKTNLILLVISVLCCIPLPGSLFKKYIRGSRIAASAVGIVLFVLCTAYLVYSSYNPFLYFRF